MPPTRTINKEQRLKSRKTIDGLFKNGRSFSVFPFRVLYLIGSAGKKVLQAADVAGLVSSLKAGFSAPTKNFKKAVDRNRIKRLTKEAYRLNQQELQAFVTQRKINLSIFLIYTGKELPDQRLVTEKISLILHQLIKKLHERHPSNP